MRRHLHARRWLAAAAVAAAGVAGCAPAEPAGDMHDGGPLPLPDPPSADTQVDAADGPAAGWQPPAPAPDTVRPHPALPEVPEGGEGRPAPEGASTSPPDVQTPGAQPGIAQGHPVQATFFDVGKADAAVVSAGDSTVMVDTGHWQRPSEAGDLLGQWTATDRIDLLVITHWHADHTGGTADILERYEVGKVWVSEAPVDSATYRRSVAAVEQSGVPYRTPSSGDTFTLTDLTVDVVGPLPDARRSDPHDAGVSVRVGNDHGYVLFTGDAEADTEAGYVAAAAGLLAADVYQVGHHGSSTSTTPALLAAVDPQVAVISVGDGNPYGHPHTAVLERLTQAGVQLWRTDQDGTVEVQLRDGRATATTDR